MSFPTQTILQPHWGVSFQYNNEFPSIAERREVQVPSVPDAEGEVKGEGAAGPSSITETKETRRVPDGWSKSSAQHLRYHT